MWFLMEVKVEEGKMFKLVYSKSILGKGDEGGVCWNLVVSRVTLPLKLYKYLGFQSHLLISNLSSSAMEFHCLPLLFSLNVILMTAQAALPPELYWERMLPNTPIPKAIRHLPKLGMKEFLLGVNKIHSEDEIHSLFIYGKKTHSEDEIHPLFIYSKKIDSEDEIPPLSFYSKKIDSEDEIPPLSFYNKKIHSEDEIPPLSFYSKKIDSEDEIPPLSFYSKKIHSEDEIPPLSFYSKKIHSKDEITPLSFHDGKNIQSEYEKTQSKGEKRSLSQVGQMMPVANHQHYNLKTNPAFFEEELRSDTELDIMFKKRKRETPLLPREIAQRIPFASEKIQEIFEMLSVKPELENVKIVKEAISLCEAPSIRGVEKHCATSLESMVDFITSKLGKNAQVISTEVEKESKSQKFLVKDGVKMLAEENLIVCHPMNYLYVVFYCHKISNTTARFMPLEGEDGNRVKALAVCHKDTSEWDPNNGFLQALQVKPGTVPVCHILPEDNLLWFAN
ncbi:hypothetical protein VNO80_19537 [Phaseolus coccineus]|uniref:BURP domain-containing protein n=1 Tax=Phaseolus coccineus TaxID=3886 RepID=A0AAN9QXF7_PHACN